MSCHSFLVLVLNFVSSKPISISRFFVRSRFVRKRSSFISSGEPIAITKFSNCLCVFLKDSSKEAYGPPQTMHLLKTAKPHLFVISCSSHIHAIFALKRLIRDDTFMSGTPETDKQDRQTDKHVPLTSIPFPCIQFSTHTKLAIVLLQSLHQVTSSAQC